MKDSEDCSLGRNFDSASDNFSFESVTVDNAEDDAPKGHLDEESSEAGVRIEKPLTPPESGPAGNSRDSPDPQEWHTLTSLLPLFKLLPGLKPRGGAYNLTGPITQDDISSFVEHSKLVKALSITHNFPSTPDDIPIAPGTITRMLAYLPTGLLPSLTHIKIDPYAWTNSWYSELRSLYPLLLDSTLSSIELDGSSAPQFALLPMLEMLQWDAPELRSLALRADEGSLHLPKEGILSVAGLTKLTHLELDEVVSFEDFELLQKIGCMPELSSLIAKDTSLAYASSSETRDESKGFMSLRSLSITASYALILDLLHHIDSMLTELTVVPVVNDRYDEKEATAMDEQAQVKEKVTVDAVQGNEGREQEPSHSPELGETSKSTRNEGCAQEPVDPLSDPPRRLHSQPSLSRSASPRSRLCTRGRRHSPCVSRSPSRGRSYTPSGALGLNHHRDSSQRYRSRSRTRSRSFILCRYSRSPRGRRHTPSPPRSRSCTGRDIHRTCRISRSPSYRSRSPRYRPRSPLYRPHSPVRSASRRTRPADCDCFRPPSCLHILPEPGTPLHERPTVMRSASPDRWPSRRSPPAYPRRCPRLFSPSPVRCASPRRSPRVRSCTPVKRPPCRNRSPEIVPERIAWAQNMEDIMGLIPARWPGLQSLTIGLIDKSKSDRVFEAPARYLASVQMLKSLESFQVMNWKLPMGSEDVLCTLTPSLKELTLPLGRCGTPVDLDTLHTMAFGYPALEKLRVFVSVRYDKAKVLKDALASAKERNIHPLQVLSVGSANMQRANMKEYTLVASVLDLLFRMWYFRHILIKERNSGVMSGSFWECVKRLGSARGASERRMTEGSLRY